MVVRNGDESHGPIRLKITLDNTSKSYSKQLMPLRFSRVWWHAPLSSKGLSGKVKNGGKEWLFKEYMNFEHKHPHTHIYL